MMLVLPESSKFRGFWQRQPSRQVFLPTIIKFPRILKFSIGFKNGSKGAK
jgi:hypothetical protein